MADIKVKSDSGKFKAGADSDLEVYSDGSNSYIKNTVNDQTIILSTKTGDTNTSGITLDGSNDVTLLGNIIMGDDTSIGISDSAERIEFDGDGDISVLGANLLVGHTAKIDSTEGFSGNLQVFGGAVPSMDIFCHSTTDAHCGALTFSKSSNATTGTGGTVVDNEKLGKIMFGGYDGSNYQTNSVQIHAEVDDSSITTNQVGGALVFSTAVGASNDDIAEKMRIAGDGAVDMSSTLTVGGDINSSGNYIVNEQGRADHVANTMPAPYYKTDGVNDYILATNNINGFPFSVSWVGRTSADVGSGSYEALFSFTDASDTAQYWGLYNDESDLTIFRRDGGSSIYTDTGFNLTANTLYHVVAVFPSATTAKIYVNGVEVYSGTGLTSVVMDSAFDQFLLGVLRTSDNTWPWGGEYHSAQVYNLELSATEVKELSSGASVPFKYKGASQTDLASGWDFTSAWAVSDASIEDANTFRCNASATGSVRKDFGTKGKRVRIRVAGTTPAGCTITVIGVDTLTNHSGSLTGTFDSTFEFLNIDDGYRIQCVNTVGSTQDTDITTFTVTEIGAVAEYDGSGITNNKWYDKSGNGLHGTVSGATDENTALTGLPVSTVASGTTSGLDTNDTEAVYTITDTHSSYLVTASTASITNAMSFVSVGTSTSTMRITNLAGSYNTQIIGSGSDIHVQCDYGSSLAYVYQVIRLK